MEIVIWNSWGANYRLHVGPLLIPLAIISTLWYFFLFFLVARCSHQMVLSVVNCLAMNLLCCKILFFFLAVGPYCNVTLHEITTSIKTLQCIPQILKSSSSMSCYGTVTTSLTQLSPFPHHTGDLWTELRMPHENERNVPKEKRCISINWTKTISHPAHRS